MGSEVVMIVTFRRSLKLRASASVVVPESRSTDWPSRTSSAAAVPISSF